jgi:NitT/TauT family transport system substrate-binding protein
MRRRAATFALVMLLACGAFAFQSSLRAEKILVTLYGRHAITLPWIMANKKGLLNDDGVTVTEVVSGAGGGTSLRNMLAGSIPYAEVTMASALAAIATGVDLVIVNAASNNVAETALATRRNSGISKLSDLAGKRIGYSNPRSISEMLVKMVLQAEGLQNAAQLISTGGYGPGYTALLSGAVDAAPLVDPQLTLDADKYSVLLSFSQKIPQLTWLVGVTSRKYASENPDKVRAFVRIRQKAMQYAIANPKEAITIYAQEFGMSEADAERLVPKLYAMNDLWSLGGFTRQGLEAVSQGLLLTQEIKKPADWKSVIDPRYLPADLQGPF